MQFARNSFWYSRLPSDVPIDPNSSAYVNSLIAQGNATTFGFSFGDYSFPLYFAEADAPIAAWTIDQSDAIVTGSYWVNMSKFTNVVPMPHNARPIGPWHTVNQPDGFGDNPIGIYQPSTDTYWEFWKSSKFEVDGPHSSGQAVGSTHLSDPGWHLESGMGIQNVSQNQGFFDATSWPTVPNNHYSSSASGLPNVAGVIRIAEAQREYIPHALIFACTVRQISPNFRWPASKTDGGSSDTTQPMEGMWFRLPPNFNLSTVADPLMRAVCAAIRDYGMILKDGAGTVSIHCESQAPIRDSQAYQTDAWLGPQGAVKTQGALLTDFGTILAKQIPWSSLQVIDPSWRPANSTITPGL